MSWADWAAYYERETRIPKPKLDMSAIPVITGIISSMLRNSVINGADARAACPLCGSTNQTLRVNLDPSSDLGLGFWKCYKCSRRGHWNTLVVELGIDPITQELDPDQMHISDPVVFVANHSYERPQGLQPWPAAASWRRVNENNGTVTVIPPKVFHLMGAQLWRTHGWTKAGDRVAELRAWLPVTQADGQIRGHVAALLGERYPGALKYKNSSGSWVREMIAFLPVARTLAGVVGSDTLIIVEGPADAMRLLALGIPAVPLLGVSSWVPRKAELLASLYTRALVCLDADAAGDGGQKRVLASLAACMSAEGLELPDGEDPASMEQTALLAILGAHGVRPRQWSL